MKLSDLDEVTKLKNHRMKYVELLRMAPSGSMDLRLSGYLDVASVISVDRGRAAIAAECVKQLAAIDAQLLTLGVEA